ncbi:MAG: T9SS type A sorting domain-containing protein [Saprospiraceae bacterium]|nr:T9SS type A sorting domain-containing protein [Saprospiraceae bacterium]
MKYTIYALFFSFLSSLTIVSAQRYEQEMFPEVSTELAVYGSNFSTYSILHNTFRQTLTMCVYRPAGDTVSNRPVVIYLHTGNFIPFPHNAGCYGTIDDSVCVEIASRLAKMGFVVAVANYRLGWNPLASSELIRRFTLANAVYRGVQDVRTCIRYFRKSVAEDGNPWGVDPEKIMVWGHGTGGILAVGAATLNDPAEWINTAEPGKFMIIPSVPMVMPVYNGDIYGNPPAPQTVCLADSFYNSLIGVPVGDTMCVANHVGYSSDISLALNMGGYLMDDAWLDSLTPPLISFHVLSDGFIPCENGQMGPLIPPHFETIMNVTGGCGIHTLIESSYHNNEIFKVADDCLNSPFIQAADAVNGGRAGFYPFIGTPGNQKAPWEWAAVPPGNANCNANSVTARAYIDTIMGYTTPLVCRALLLCCLVGTKEQVKTEIPLSLTPNPAWQEVSFTVPGEYLMQAIEMYDASGRMVRSLNDLNDSSAQLDRGNLPAGIYIVKVYLAAGIVARKVVFE